MNSLKGALRIFGLVIFVAFVLYSFYEVQMMSVLLNVLQWIVFSLWLYWFVISLFGFGKAKRIRERFPQKKFLLMIPAHNEEKVIGNIVENLQNLDYPRHLYDILVIADNCTDHTAAIVRRHGAVVLEHTSQPDEPKGKPHAIKYTLDYLGDDLYEYDAFVIFDADNLVSLNYLKEMNNQATRSFAWVI